jgi:hypothetical protein
VIIAAYATTGAKFVMIITIGVPTDAISIIGDAGKEERLLATSCRRRAF